MGYWIFYKANSKLENLSILCSLTFQRGLYFGTSQNGIEHQQNRTKGVFDYKCLVTPTVVHVTFLQHKRYELMDPFVFLSFIDNSIATTSGEGGIQTLVLLINETKQYH